MAFVKPATKAFMFIEAAPILEETDTVKQRSRLLGMPMKQLEVNLMDYLRWLQ